MKLLNHHTKVIECTLSSLTLIVANVCQEDISHIISKADTSKSGTLSLKEFHGVIDDVMERYPQLELHLKSKQMSSIHDLLKNSSGKYSGTEVDIETFKSVLSQADSQMKNLPATAQVNYLYIQLIHHVSYIYL